MSTHTVFVAGATGYLGRHLVLSLKDAGHRVHALARDPAGLRGGGGGIASAHAPDVADLCDEIIVAQASQPDTLVGACDGCDVFISALGKRTMTRRPTVFDVDRDANLNLLQRAREAGVEHVIFVSASHGEELAQKGADLAMAREAVVSDILENDPVWTIVRPTGFFNDMEAFFSMCAKGTGWIFGDGSTQINPIHGADLAARITEAVGARQDRGKVLEVGGPDTLSFRAILALAFETLGKPARIRSVPYWALRMSAAVTYPFNPMAGGLLKTFWLLRDMNITGTPVGTHRLRDFFAALAQEKATGSR